MIKVVLISLVMALAACSAKAQSVDTENRFNIAGVELLDSPNDVFSTLKKNGFKKVKNYEGEEARQPSFNELIKIEKGKLRFEKADGAWKWVRYKKSNEEILLTFFAMPESEVLIRVNYTNNDQSVSYKDFEKMVLTKYGKPNYDSSMRTHMWCSNPIVKPGYLPSECPEGEVFLKSESYKNEKTILMATGLDEQRSVIMKNQLGDGETSF